MRRWIALCALMAVATGCTTAPVQDRIVAIPKAKSADVEIAADPRIELINVVGLLSGYFLITQHDQSYKAEAKDHFAPFADHVAVHAFKRLSKDDFAFSKVPDAMVRLTAPPALEPRAVTSQTEPQDAKTRAQVAELLPLLRDFAVVSRFDQFYGRHEPFYESIAEGARSSIEPAIRDLEAYTGTEIQNASVLLSPLLHDGGFATTLVQANGMVESYAFIGPERASAGLPDFGGRTRMEDLVAHEFAHGIINPLTTRHEAMVARLADRFPPIAEAMKKRGYSDWQSVVNELVIRAVTTRIITRSRGDAAGEVAMKRELEWGYSYLPSMTERLKRYEQNRDTYPTIAHFYPVLLESLSAAP